MYDFKYFLEICDIVPTIISQNCDVTVQKSAQWYYAFVLSKSVRLHKYAIMISQTEIVKSQNCEEIFEIIFDVHCALHSKIW